MSNERFTEDSYEQTLIELFQQMGYTYEKGPEMERDYREPVDKEELRKCLYPINKNFVGPYYIKAEHDEVIAEAVRKVTSIDEGTLEQRNERFMDYLQNGVEVGYNYNGSQETALVRLIDYRRPNLNTFKVVNQYSVEEFGKIRCDMVVFVNGLPLVVMELKSPSREGTDDEDAFRQIKQYQQKCPSLFVYNAFSVISDKTAARHCLIDKCIQIVVKLLDKHL